MRAILLRVPSSLFFRSTLGPSPCSLSFFLSQSPAFFFGPTTPVPLYESARSARETCATPPPLRCACVRRECVCACVRAYPCSRASSYVAARACVRARTRARLRGSVCGRARACVCTRRCARERFTPDYNASRTSDYSYIERRSRWRGKARATPKIALANARIYRAALTALVRAESIYFVGTVCAANTVG